MVVGAGLCLGVALRVGILVSSQGVLDSDEAVVGLMARHVLHGQLTTFFWGQWYGGTQETLVTAALFWVFGPGTVVLKAVPILFWAAALVLLWRVARRVLGEPRAGIAAALFWIWPIYFVWKSTKAHAFYGAGLVFGLWAMLAALRLRDRTSRRDLASLGLAIGLGLWATPQVAVLALPSLLWLVTVRPATVRRAPIAVASFALGSLPWWIYNVHHAWGSLHNAPGNSTWTGRLHGFASATLPTELGLRLPFSLAWLPDVDVGAAVYTLMLLGLAYLLVRRPAGLGLPLLAAVSAPIFIAASPYGWLVTEPRYLAFATPALALLLASAARSRARALAVVGAAALLSIAGFALMVSRDLAADDTPLVLPADFRPLLTTLAAHHVDRVWASYWIAYRITFESEERIVAALPGSTRYISEDGRVHPADEADIASQGRYAPYQLAVARARNAAFVFAPEETGEAAARERLRRAGYRLIREDNLDTWLPPQRPSERVGTAEALGRAPTQLRQH